MSWSGGGQIQLASDSDEAVMDLIVVVEVVIDLRRDNRRHLDDDRFGKRLEALLVRDGSFDGHPGPGRGSVRLGTERGDIVFTRPVIDNPEQLMAERSSPKTTEVLSGVEVESPCPLGLPRSRVGAQKVIAKPPAIRGGCASCNGVVLDSRTAMKSPAENPKLTDTESKINYLSF